MSSHNSKILVIPRREMSTFLSTLPGELSLSSILLPGTHDTMAFYGWPVSQCQSLSTPLTAQLRSGIRVLDVRLAVVSDRLISYHGVYPQRTPFQVVLATLFAFLTDPTTSNETVVVSIKQEDFEKTPPHRFSLLVRDEIIHSPGGLEMWFLENRIPKLGEVRGKAVMFSRFGGDGSGWEDGLEGIGIHPGRWPDNEKNGFYWQCKNTLVRTHDWYNISSFLFIPEKVGLATRNLLLDANPESSVPILPVSYFSAASFPLAFPTMIARGFGWPRWGVGVEGVNSRLGKWLLEQLAKGINDEDCELKPSFARCIIRGWAFLDFYAQPKNGSLIPLLVECNFVGSTMQ
ncbi:hypothetical protein AX17_001919 [Amanita inopinata Kibby_2008]|nr:hypothetical protein AX17_001919 [Amanita inopinata Kibby_2008]